jgi:hypothetical protein
MKKLILAVFGAVMILIVESSVLCVYINNGINFLVEFPLPIVNSIFVETDCDQRAASFSKFDKKLEKLFRKYCALPKATSNTSVWGAPFEYEIFFKNGVALKNFLKEAKSGKFGSFDDKKWPLEKFKDLTAMIKWDQKTRKPLEVVEVFPSKRWVAWRKDQSKL